MMNQVLPATVEELNTQQAYKASRTLILKKSGFEDIAFEKRLKREASLPGGLLNWNISNFDSYLNFDDVLESVIIHDFDVLASPEDRLVPESDPRDRSSSISSMASTMEDKQVTFHNFGVKTINTVCQDSGSTCISSDHTYFGKNSTLTESLDPGETYQNLDIFLQQVPDVSIPETIPSSFSPLPSTSSNDSFELTVLETIKSFNEHTVQSEQSTEPRFSFPSTSMKRTMDSISEDDVFVLKQAKLESDEIIEGTRYHEIRRKNNIASKTCRKTRKEKQKDMEQKVTQLEQEREHLKVQVQVLEELIAAHKQCLLNAISQKR